MTAKEILQRHEVAKQAQLAIASIWREVAAYADPLNVAVIAGSDAISPSISGGADLFDTTGREAAKIYAAGCMSWITPPESTWFAFGAPSNLKHDEAAKSWYNECSEIAREVLANTNFYSEIHSAYMDDGIFGTCGLMMREDPKTGIYFESLRAGTYTILENNRREVDTLFRVLKFSALDMFKEFGEASLPTAVRNALADPKKADNKDIEVLHTVYPRTERDRFKSNIQNAPVASTWIDLKSKQTVKESGFFESPMAIHRHLLFGAFPYGRSPGMEAIFDMRQLNYIQSQLDTLVEKQVTPPVLAPAEFEGVIDLRAEGVTYTRDMQNAPRFWENPGNYLVGDDRTEFRKRQINNAFHVELFQTLGSVPTGKVMTAEEVRARQRDRLPTFSPTFARKTRELNDPIMRTVFSMLLRAGAFPPPPKSVAQELPDDTIFVPDPKVSYSSRMALALQIIHNDALQEVMGISGEMGNIAPQIFDNFDFDKAIREYSRNAGLPESILVPEQQRDDMRRARAQAEAQAQQDERQVQEADAVAKLGSAMK